MLVKRLDIKKATVADGAAGFGWLSFAFLQAGAKKAFLIEPDQHRLEASQEIAKILGVYNQCEFVPELLQNIDFAADSVDVFASIETLEHVTKPNVNICLNNIAHSTREVVLLTTPNRLFPVVAHDTRLPFAHWMPAGLRKPYAQIFKKRDKDSGNYFLAPWDLNPLYQKFKPDAAYTMFSSIEEFDEFYPHYIPYLTKHNRERPSAAYRLFVNIVGHLFSNYAFTVSPNLATVWVRRH